MSNKLALAVHQKYKRSNSKSRITNQITSNLAHSPKHSQKELIFHSPKATELVQTFQTEILTPIQLYSQMHQQKAPQKCLQHDNIATLYCIRDERLLCAGCMYQTPIHKGHKVIPLSKAFDNIKVDIQNTVNLVEEHLMVSKRVIEKTVQNIEKAEKEYPQLMEQIHNFFMELHQLLIQRKNEQLHLLNQIWSKLRYQNYAMKTEMTKICDYVETKVRQVSESQPPEDLTFNKNVVDQLSKLTQLIHKNMVKVEDNPYFKQINKFKSITQYLNNNLVLVEIQSRTTQSHLSDSKIKKSNSKTSIKRISTPKSPTNNESSKFKGKTAQQILIEMYRQNADEEGSTKGSPKNRHSKSEVSLMIELANRKKEFQKDKLKKIKLSPVKSHRSINNQVPPSPKSMAKQKLQKSIK